MRRRGEGATVPEVEAGPMERPHRASHDGSGHLWLRASSAFELQQVIHQGSVKGAAIAIWEGLHPPCHSPHAAHGTDDIQATASRQHYETLTIEFEWVFERWKFFSTGKRCPVGVECPDFPDNIFGVAMTMAGGHCHR